MLTETDRYKITAHIIQAGNHQNRVAQKPSTAPSRRLSNCNKSEPVSWRSQGGRRYQGGRSDQGGRRDEREGRRLDRSTSSPRWNNSALKGEDYYYRPMSTFRRRHTKSEQTQRPHNDTGRAQDELITPLTKHAWQTFRGHIAMLSGSDGISNSHKHNLSMKASDIHKQVVSDLKARSLRKKTKTLIMRTKIMKAKEFLMSMEDVSESDEEEEDEKESAMRRRQTAQRYWSIIRRDINEKIRIRKLNNQANNSWNILRHQIRAQTQAQAVRRELYIKYGVVKPCSTVQPIDKPILSESAQKLINTFQALHVTNIPATTNNSLTTAAASEHDNTS